MANKPGYFEQYYASNRETINEKRRTKYASDDGYRDRVLMASRDYRKRQRGGKVRVPRYKKPTILQTGDGKGEIRLFSVGALAHFLSRSVQSVNHWEKIGILPRTPYRDDRSRRFYTPAMMYDVRVQVGTKRRLFPVDPEMHSIIAAAWASHGVPVDFDADDPESQMAEAIGNTVYVEDTYDYVSVDDDDDAG